MAKTINYDRICPECNGKPVEWGLRWRWGVFKFYKIPSPYIKSICGACKHGVQKPKKVMMKADRLEPSITY